MSKNKFAERLVVLLALLAATLAWASAIEIDRGAVFLPVKCEAKNGGGECPAAYFQMMSDNDDKRLRIFFVAGANGISGMTFSIWQGGKKISPDLNYRYIVGGRQAFVLDIARPEELKTWMLPDEVPKIVADVRVK